MEFIREHRPSLRVVLLVGCLGLFGLTGISLIISGVVTGEIYYTDYDFSAIWERFQKRFLWVGIIIPLVGIVVSILIAAKITEPVHEIIERAERFRRGDRSAFRQFFRTPVTAEHKQLLVSVSNLVNELDAREIKDRRVSEELVHDLANGLFRVKNIVSNLQDYESSMTPKMKELQLIKIKGNVDALHRMAEEIYELTQSHSTRTSKGQDVSLVAVCDTVDSYFTGDNLEIKRSGNFDVERIALSQIMLESILISLISNSYKHGGANVSVRLTLETVASPIRQLMITVDDDGIGIPPEHRDSIFEESFSTSQGVERSGMGLSNTKNLLEFYGGNIEPIPSKKGASFLVKIPLVE